MTSELSGWPCGRETSDAVWLETTDPRLVEFVASDDVVASSGSSTTSHVCRVASGANETRRLAT